MSKLPQKRYSPLSIVLFVHCMGNISRSYRKKLDTGQLSALRILNEAIHYTQCGESQANSLPETVALRSDGIRSSLKAFLANR